MDEQEELLFLSTLYKTWPWCYDNDAIIALHKRIITMQHRELVKIKSKKDLKINRTKSKKNQKKQKKEFSPQIIDLE